MAWRELVIESPCKISASLNYLVIRGETTKRIHMSEISYVVVANPNINITGVALAELAKNKVKVVFCDEKHNPCFEIVSHYGCYDTSGKIKKQMRWNESIASAVNINIIRQKILNQALVLAKKGFEKRAEMLFSYVDEIEQNDATNREGHAAKVYFNTLFGNEFTRDVPCDENKALNYGYAIILSCINREVVANGFLTQIGINHCNEFNPFNFSCDIIEPFRVIVDEFVYDSMPKAFDTDYKHELVDLLNKNVFLGNNTTLLNAIKLNVKSVIDALNENNPQLVKLYCHV